VILHGWAMSSFFWQPISEKLNKAGFRAIAIDLPGSGESSEPNEIWGNDDYADFVLNFLEKIDVHKFNLIGHSFGGAVSLKIAAKNPEKIIKLVLCDAAVIRGEQLTLRQKISKFIAGIAPGFIRKIPGHQFFEKILYRFAGVSDYYKASPMMREIFKKVVSEDLSHLAQHIKSPCLIIWGENDLATPLSDALTLNKLISDSELKIIPGVGHNPYRRKPEEFFEAVGEFLKK
jgi:pimeloyl-ACP methyl ester carboxylesterase